MLLTISGFNDKIKMGKIQNSFFQSQQFQSFSKSTMRIDPEILNHSLYKMTLLIKQVFAIDHPFGKPVQSLSTKFWKMASRSQTVALDAQLNKI